MSGCDSLAGTVWVGTHVAIPWRCPVSNAVKPVIPESTTWKSLTSGIVLLDLSSGSYHLLNETASSIWRSIVEEKAVDEIVDDLVSEFDCTREVAAVDVDELIEHLVEEHLLELPA